MEINFVNGDLLRMADSLREQEREINDWDDFADERRAHLHRAIAHLHLAFAELNSMPLRRLRPLKKKERDPLDVSTGIELAAGYVNENG